MTVRTKKWLHGIGAAFIGGAAAGGVAFVQDPATFNFSEEGWVKLGTVCLVSGVIAAFAYLKQSPVPPSK